MAGIKTVDSIASSGGAKMGGSRTLKEIFLL
jgi:hypothetical protein